MNIKESQLVNLKVHEAFIRRASEVNMPFMLKGSYVTRQYFPAGVERQPADLDWVYLDMLNDEKTAREIFNSWAIQATAIEQNDDVKFRSFRQNEFWRRIDYAMSDDFPTVNTDILCWLGEERIEFGLDLSFNLDVDDKPVSLLYQPLVGEAFMVPYTAPLSLQVSWKIHQTLVRPRFKDLFDLLYLVKHSSFTKETLNISLQALINECTADNVDLKNLKKFLAGNLYDLFPRGGAQDNWLSWRHGVSVGSNKVLDFDKAEFVTDASKLPAELPDFLKLFQKTMEEAGLGVHLMKQLPEPTRQTRRTHKLDDSTDSSKADMLSRLRNLFR